ncbi:hypothetical protein ACFZ8E_26700 [Methylobacterium sp. HMF5984]|uniref:hypothetical protein n=1 Tax=Methylobacterium sp. HMF5984 TaxID=3367370 RepID=UPI00385492CB
MTNDDEQFPHAKLPACFALSVSDLADMIRAAAQPGGSEGAAPRNAEVHLLTIRANAAKGMPGLYDALDAVRSAVRAVEDIARREPTLVPYHAELLAIAQTHALSALSFLTAVLCIAKPNARASASWSGRAAS